MALGGYGVSSAEESKSLPRDLGNPPHYEILLEYEPTDDAEERLLMAYEILLGMDNEISHEDKRTQETA